jgi:hypothetical protein
VVDDVDIKEKKERADRQQRRLISDGTSHGQPMDGIGKDRLGKVRLGYDSIGNEHIIVDSIESSTPTFKFASQFSSAEFRATKYLIDLMIKNNPKVKVPKPETKQFEVWCESMDKLHRIDKMSWDDIKTIVDFSQNDQFWQSNILSTSKLREKKDTLILQLSRNKPKDTFGRQMEEMKGWDLG